MCGSSEMKAKKLEMISGSGALFNLDILMNDAMKSIKKRSEGEFVATNLNLEKKEAWCAR